MGDGTCGPGDYENELVSEWKERYTKAGRPTYGYNCNNDFVAWLCHRLEECNIGPLIDLKNRERYANKKR